MILQTSYFCNLFALLYSTTSSNFILIQTRLCHSHNALSTRLFTVIIQLISLFKSRQLQSKWFHNRSMSCFIAILAPYKGSYFLHAFWQENKSILSGGFPMSKRYLSTKSADPSWTRQFFHPYIRIIDWNGQIRMEQLQRSALHRTREYKWDLDLFG